MLQKLQKNRISCLRNRHSCQVQFLSLSLSSDENELGMTSTVDRSQDCGGASPTLQTPPHRSQHDPCGERDWRFLYISRNFEKFCKKDGQRLVNIVLLR